MDIAIVTGAETPLGQRITERLIEQGCRVHGIGNNFSKVTYADPQFKAHAVDLTDLEAVRATTQAILDEEKRLHILVHAIDVTPGTAFRKLPLGNLEAILKIGLLGPVMLTRMLLPNLMRFRGQLINIIPANKSGHEASAINALIEGGLRSMNNALFDQARDAGLRITNLLLRQNTELPAGTASDDQLIQSRIDPEDVANAVERLLDPHATNVPNEITLYPQLSAQAEAALPEAPEPLDPYAAVVLPPKDYFPPEPEPIPTKQADSIQRVIPYTDDEMEEMVAAALEDFEADPQRYKEEMRTGGGQQQTNEDGQGGGKKKRRRRRGGRNRNKNRGEQDENTLDSTDAPAEPTGEGQKPSAPAKESKGEKTEAPAGESSQEEKSDKPKRRRGGRNRNRDRKPRPEEGEGGTEGEAAPQKDARSNRRRNVREKLESEDRKDSSETKPKAKAAETPAESTAAPASEEKPVKKKAAKTSTGSAPRKKAAKKPAKKAAKKAEPEQLELTADAKPAKKKAAKASTSSAPRKKTAAKKATKKAAKKKTATKKAAKTSTSSAPRKAAKKAVKTEE